MHLEDTSNADHHDKVTKVFQPCIIINSNLLRDKDGIPDLDGSLREGTQNVGNFSNLLPYSTTRFSSWSRHETA